MNKIKPIFIVICMLFISCLLNKEKKNNSSSSIYGRWISKMPVDENDGYQVLELEIKRNGIIEIIFTSYSWNNSIDKWEFYKQETVDYEVEMFDEYVKFSNAEFDWIAMSVKNDSLFWHAVHIFNGNGNKLEGVWYGNEDDGYDVQIEFMDSILYKTNIYNPNSNDPRYYTDTSYFVDLDTMYYDIRPGYPGVRIHSGLPTPGEHIDTLKNSYKFIEGNLYKYHTDSFELFLRN